MNFEVLSYGLVFVAASVFAAANKKSVLAFRIVLLVTCLFYILSIRMAEFDQDINVYARELSSQSTGLYYMKEALYWFGSRFIFMFLGSEALTFIFVDIVAVILFFSALRKFAAPKYSYFLILILFPSVFGFQNIYRQLLATAFILLGLALIYSGRRGWGISGLAAALVHNPSALFIPLHQRVVRRFPWVGVLVGVLLGSALGLLSRFESESASGGNYSYVLSTVVLIIVVLLFMKTPPRQRVFRGFFLGLGAIAVLSPVLLAPATSERISFYAITILFPFLVLWVEESLRPRVPVRGFLVLIFSVPTFLSSARGFIVY